MTEVRSVVVVTPRTHPNLAYLLDDLLRQQIKPVLLVERVSRDFSVPVGARVLLSTDPLPPELVGTIDLVILRHFA